MATHKVPQDVEAEDKLVGPLSLKQFIFTVAGLGFGYLVFFFFTKVHPLAALIWILPMGVCLVLGLYQRKDQPVEVFLASALQFYLKPHKRIWDQEGYEERVVITAPPQIEKHYTKGYTQGDINSRLTNLSSMMDTRGWASKQIADWQNPALVDVVESDRLLAPSDLAVATEPVPYIQAPVDIMDENTSPVAQHMQAGLQQAAVTTQQDAMRTLQQARSVAAQPQAQSVPQPQPVAIPEPDYTADPAILDKITHQHGPSMHQKTLKTPEQMEKEAHQKVMDENERRRQAALAEIAELNDVDIETQSKLAEHLEAEDGNEVVINHN